MICANLKTHKLEMIKWYFIIFIDGTISDHILVIRNSYENIVKDGIEPRGGKKAKTAKEYELGLYIGIRSIKP